MLRVNVPNLVRSPCQSRSVSKRSDVGIVDDKEHDLDLVEARVGQFQVERGDRESRSFGPHVDLDHAAAFGQVNRDQAVALRRRTSVSGSMPYASRTGSGSRWR